MPRLFDQSDPTRNATGESPAVRGGMTARVVLCAATLAALACATRADARELRADLFDGIDGATCKYFNAGALLPWRRPLGDWLDADGTPHGPRPFASASIPPGDDARTVEWDVTPLVRAWLAGTAPASGIVLATLPPATSVDFASRESAPGPQRPRLFVQFDDSALPVAIGPTADTWLDCSTRYSLGSRGTLRVGPSLHVAMQFDTTPLNGRAVAKAVLRLTATGPGRAAGVVGVFQLDPPKLGTGPGDHRGLAAGHPRDAGIGADPDVWLAADFESDTWKSAWSYVSPASRVERVARDDRLSFEPLSGHALRVNVAKGDNLGLDMGFDFAQKIGFEPDDVYFRYYLRFADDWRPTVDGGKLPGLSGTYGRAGWGGRPVNGTNGWSLRGHFNRAPSPGNPLRDRITVGTYAYHADMTDKFGDLWSWLADGVGMLERNRWYCLEQRLKINTPGKTDGIFQAWVDGALALEKLDVNVRTVPDIRIERVWMNVYHGGTARAARDMHLYIDGVVVARRPIGCSPG